MTAIKPKFKTFWSCWEYPLDVDSGARRGIPLMTEEQIDRLYGYNSFAESNRSETPDNSREYLSWLTNQPSGEQYIPFDFQAWFDQTDTEGGPFSYINSNGDEILIGGGEPTTNQIAMPIMPIPCLSIINIGGFEAEYGVTRDMFNPFPKEAWYLDPTRFYPVNEIKKTDTFQLKWTSETKGYLHLDQEGTTIDTNDTGFSNITKTVQASISRILLHTDDYEFLAAPECPADLKKHFEDAAKMSVIINSRKVKEFAPGIKVSNYSTPGLLINGSPSNGRPWGNGVGDYTQEELDEIDKRANAYAEICRYMDWMGPINRPFYWTSNAVNREKGIKKASVLLCKKINDIIESQSPQEDLLPPTTIPEHQPTQEKIKIYIVSATRYHYSRKLGGTNWLGSAPQYMGTVEDGVFTPTVVDENGNFIWNKYPGSVWMNTEQHLDPDDGNENQVTFEETTIDPLLTDGADGLWLYSGWDTGSAGVYPPIMYPIPDPNDSNTWWAGQNQLTTYISAINSFTLVRGMMYGIYVCTYSFKLHNYGLPKFADMVEEVYQTYPELFEPHSIIGTTAYYGSTDDFSDTNGWLNGSYGFFRSGTKLANYPLTPLEQQYKDWWTDPSNNAKLLEAFRGRQYELVKTARDMALTHQFKNMGSKSKLTQAINTLQQKINQFGFSQL